LDRKTKEQVVAELNEQLRDVKLAVLTGYSGMDVAKLTTLRNVLRKSGTEFRVVKNTLLRIASQDTSFSTLEQHFKGPLAVAISHGDAVEMTKVLTEFARKNAQLEIKAGILEGRVLSKSDISVLAELPSREVLLGKLLSLLVGVQGQLVNVWSAVPRSFVGVLDAYRVKKESAN
jgi:large subunit ribosomal protein L10